MFYFEVYHPKRVLNGELTIEPATVLLDICIILYLLNMLKYFRDNCFGLYQVLLGVINNIILRTIEVLIFERCN